MCDASPKLKIIRDVLESAKDVGEHGVVAACRRLIWAHYLGWREYADPADIRLVFDLADEVL